MTRFLYLVGFLILVSCAKNEPIEQTLEEKLTIIPEGFPDVLEPVDNPFSVAKWELGKKLFFDPILSRDKTVSCASCHLPEHAFSDVISVSLGVEDTPGRRNAPSLANVAYHPYLTREGSVPTLEMQILVPIQESDEFDFNIVLIAERLSQDSSYVEMARQAFDRDMDHFVITRSIACFERTLISGNSRYDQFTYQNKFNVLSESEQSGLELFFSERTNCSQCHSGFNFTNYSFANNGLYTEYADVGRFRFTEKEEDLAKFKVPSLRNVAVTAPYMHDGSMMSLEEIVDHYNEGGESHKNKSDLLRPLGLSNQEKSDLVAFLHTLTDDDFISNELFSQ